MSYRSGRRIPLGVVCLLLLVLLGGAGCGNQGDPAPPLRSVPAATSDLKIRQQGNRLLLDFTFPQTTPAGIALGGITSIEVWEAVQPAPREGKPAPIDSRVFQAAATQKLALGQQDVGPATFGNRILIPLALPEPAPATPEAPPEAPREARYFAVRTTGPTGDRSEFSNQVAIVPGTPPAAPERLSMTARPDGVLVEWSGTEGAANYNVYRRGAEERSLGQPIHSAGPQERSWLDNTARMGQNYIYGVTAVKGLDPLVESTVASEQEVRYQDRFPPPPPLELVALAEGGRVRLVWRAAEAEDLAGYYVYRRGSEGDFARITPQPLQETELVDPGVSAGQTYSYRVTAVDQLGNESGPGAEVRASVPQ